MKYLHVLYYLSESDVLCILKHCIMTVYVALEENRERLFKVFDIIRSHFINSDLLLCSQT